MFQYYSLKATYICISEVIDISPSNLDSSSCFLQSSISHDVLCIEVKQAGWQYTALYIVEVKKLKAARESCVTFACLLLCHHSSKHRFTYIFKFSEVKLLSRVWLCDPMDCNLPGSIHEIFQARILEWVAISFSRGSSQPRDRTRVSRIVGRCFTFWATREFFSF